MDWRSFGPAYLVAIGYMDPGNWATDLQAGNAHRYALLWVVFLASAMAMLLQHLCVRLGVYGQVDLAEGCRLQYSRPTRMALYGLAEVAIVACDVADVLGTAIALKLLFRMPIKWGVLMTIADFLVVLSGVQGRALEIVVMVLMGFIGVCFMVLLFLIRPDFGSVAAGLMPSSIIFRDTDALVAALGILGATVMPHNLYLHSSLVKASPAGSSPKEQVRTATADLLIALSIAFLVNGAILIVAAASAGSEAVTSLEDASRLLAQLLGPFAQFLFGAALLAAGLSSTMTGTMAGQIVFEGFLELPVAPWLRRLLTRSLAIVPAFLLVLVLGEAAVGRVLIWSQVVLSLQLPFAIVPLTRFVFDPFVCPLDEKAREHRWLRWCSWAVGGSVIALNLLLIIRSIL